MNFTTIEQSKKLLEAGLNPDTADMCYLKSIIPVKNCCLWREEWDKFPVMVENIEIEDILPEPETYPCWSTGALIDLLPKYIRNKCIDYPLLILCNSTSFDVEYNAKVIAEIGFNRDNLIDALVEMVLWCLENGYIEKKGE